MVGRLVGVLVIIGIVGACAPVPIKLEGEVDVNVVQKDSSKKSTSIQGKPKGPKFDYISTLTLNVGPCPKRDAASYGLLLKSRTKVENGQITCYYN